MLRARQLLVVQAGQGTKGVGRKGNLSQQHRSDNSPVCPVNDELLGLLGAEVQGSRWRG